MTTAQRPTPMAVRPYEFPRVHHATTANGLRITVAPMRRLPIVTVLALVDAGAATDAPGAEGLAALAARTLAEGTGALDGAALTERFEALGTGFEASADWDSTVARLTVTPTHLDQAFALFADVLRAPRFPAADVARRRDERLDDLEQQLAEPRGLADQRFTGFVYAPTARFARPAGGTARSVARLDHSHVRAFHDARVGPRTTRFIVVGDIGADEAVALVERRFGDWGADVARPVGHAPDLPRADRRAIIIEKADAPQSELRIGHVGVPRTHDDYLPLVVMNAILGGLFSSRINLNLRERHAFTYGASSGFDWRRAAGPFVIGTAVRSDVTARAVEEILGEVHRMREAPPTAEELSLAVDYLAGVFPIRYETTASVASALAGAALFDLPDDWFRTYRDCVRAVDAAAVLRVARAHLDPDRLLVLAVGDPTTIREPLATTLATTLGLDVGVHAAAADPTELE